jgi:hypothetical protein
MTTAAIEAMLINIPVFFIESAIYKLEDWEYPFPIFNLNRFKNFSEFQNVIQKFYEDINIANNIIKKQKDILEYTIGIDSNKIKKILLDNFSNFENKFNFEVDKSYNIESNLIHQNKIIYLRSR